jgi:hypothetical protein
MESKSRWYYENHGKAEGPISTLELVKKIQGGDLKLIDLVFKEGDGQWMPAEHFSEIKSLIKTASTEFSVDSDWVVLRTIEVDGRNQYDQIGPFTIEQVLQLIDKGKIKFTDFVWRNGYENWVPLGHLDKYENPLDSSIRVDMSIYEKPKIQELEDVPKPTKLFKSSQKTKSVSIEEKPPEAQGEDLAKEKWHVEVPSRQKAKDAAPFSVVASEAEHSPRRRRNAEDENPSNSNLEPTKKEQMAVAKQRWSTVASALAVFIFLSGSTLVIFFGHKAYLSHQARSLKMTEHRVSDVKSVEPKLAATPLPRKTDVTPMPKSEKKTLEHVVSVAPLKEVKQVSLFAQMTTKQKSYFYNSERLFLFYNSQKGLQLIAEVEKLLKPSKSKQKTSPKKQIEAWATKVQVFHQAILAEGRNERLYPELFKRLSLAASQLSERSLDLQSQILNGRGPTKEWTLVEVGAEFKKLFKLAQDLD